MGSGGTGGTKRQICRRLTDFETQNRVWSIHEFSFTFKIKVVYLYIDFGFGFSYTHHIYVPFLLSSPTNKKSPQSFCFIQIKCHIPRAKICFMTFV